jgi:hypothetical protein
MQCVAVDSNGVLSVVTDAATTCQYYLLQPTDSAFFGIFDPNWVINNGGTDVLQHFFFVGFSIPMIAYLTAWGFGELISMFNDNSRF